MTQVNGIIKRDSDNTQMIIIIIKENANIEIVKILDLKTQQTDDTCTKYDKTNNDDTRAKMFFFLVQLRLLKEIKLAQ